MSRIGAGAGALTFGFVGALLGNAVGAHVRGRSALASGVSLNSDEEQLGTGIGGVLGILVGAAIGAGPGPESQTKTGLSGITYFENGTKYETAPRLSAAAGSAIGTAVAGGGLHMVMRKPNADATFWAMLAGGAAGAAIGAHLAEKKAPNVTLNERGELVGTSGVGMYLGKNEAFP